MTFVSSTSSITLNTKSSFTSSSTICNVRFPSLNTTNNCRTRRAVPTPAPCVQPISIRAAKDDRTFLAVKPDGMNRAVLGNIISRFEAKGFQLVGIKTLVPSRQLAETHYAALSEKPFFKDLVDFITSGPVCAMVWQGESVVSAARTMIGETNPLSSAPGTIRGDFGLDIGRNVIHGSDAPETAAREISIWFEPSEIADWTPTRNVWIYE